MPLTAAELLRACSERAPGLVSVIGAPPPGAPSAAEQALQLRFADEYRAFLEQFGAAEVGTCRIYGIDLSSEAETLSVVAHTLQARAAGRIGPDELVLASWDDLTLEVQTVTGDRDGPVREVSLDGSGELLGATFVDWLEYVVREELDLDEGT
ncbi:SUKH superfamily protein [Solirubrobacter pauli]|uniref:SUKH superfamily protein n=1 Tax=Solirubrobacter pauli TaxID=166793 RepID=A0A660L1L6_9ACTN|nr:SMI1/KNR4 family protein [Solirubrobacter pauli]RKQ86792.1 SUKH superfamily protein [Solirubrobacter pauli]